MIIETDGCIKKLRRIPYVGRSRSGATRQPAIRSSAARVAEPLPCGTPHFCHSADRAHGRTSGGGKWFGEFGATLILPRRFCHVEHVTWILIDHEFLYTVDAMHGGNRPARQ
jgi:hypothetical protein